MACTSLLSVNNACTLHRTRRWWTRWSTWWWWVHVFNSRLLLDFHSLYRRYAWRWSWVWWAATRLPGRLPGPGIKLSLSSVPSHVSYYSLLLFAWYTLVQQQRYSDDFQGRSSMQGTLQCHFVPSISHLHTLGLFTVSSAAINSTNFCQDKSNELLSNCDHYASDLHGSKVRNAGCF